MEFYMDDVNEQGFASIPVGEYAVAVGEWWYRHKEDTGNYVIDMDLHIVDGEYEGETMRNFHAIAIDKEGNATAKTKGFLYQMLKAFGFVDEKPDKIEFIYGDEDDDGRVEIISVEVDGKEVDVAGKTALAVVTSRVDTKTKEKLTGVSRILRLEDDEEDEEEEAAEEEEKPKKTAKKEEKKPAPKSKAKGKGGKKKGMPF